MRSRRRAGQLACGVFRVAAVVLCAAASAQAQIGPNCTVSVLNRSVTQNADGSWVLPNVPANSGPVRARATCLINGETISGESDPFIVPANGVVNLPPLRFGQTTPIPTALTVTGPPGGLTGAGQTAQLTVTAIYRNGTTRNVTAASNVTTYTISNPAIATVSADGVVQAVQSGTVIVQASHEGASGMTSVRVALGGGSDTDGDGIPDDEELRLGLNPNNAVDALEDFDRDNLTNRQEYQLGTNLRVADTDGDGLRDGDEVARGTSPFVPDTDGDRIPDGVEVTTGSDPLNPLSYDLRAATASSNLRPQAFRLSTSPLALLSSQQLTWSVTLIDGRTTLDLTADPRTQYASDNLQICNFGLQRGLVFAGNAGTCHITVTNNTLSVVAEGTIQTFSPAEISSISVAGAVGVDSAGRFAYIAAGANGLVVIDLDDPTVPRRRGSLAGIGDARAVRINGQNAVVADATGFLRVVSVASPDAPTLQASIRIAGQPGSLAVHGTIAAVAAQAGGVTFVDLSVPTAPAILATVALPGAALGVDFDLERGVGVVAMGTAGIRLIELTNPAAPQLRGSLPGGDVRRVHIKYPAVLLADVQRSVTAVDISNPNFPILTSSIPSTLGGAPVDIASFGPVAMTADVSFGRAIPVISVANPLQPSTVLFWTLGSAGFSSSVAVDTQFGYVVLPNQLRIFQYQGSIDTAGIAPTVQITAPANGATEVHGGRITVTANATDDVAVSQVTFTVNGQPVVTRTSAPFAFTYSVPASDSSVTFGALATDFGNNTGEAGTVTVHLIPDPLTTAAGTVVHDGQPVAAAMVACLGLTGSTLADGSFSIPNVPTLTALSCTATAVSPDGLALSGTSVAAPPVRAGTTQVGTIAIGPIPIISALSRRSALVNSATSLTVTGSNFVGTQFSLNALGSSVAVSSIDAAGTHAALSVQFGTSPGTFALVGTNGFGSSPSAVTPANRFTVVDPNSTGDTDGDGFPDAIEGVFGTDPLDGTSVPTPNGQMAGQVDARPVSILNVAGSAPNQPSSQEVNPTGFSVLNLAGAGSVQPISQEASAVPFSVLNTAGVAPGQTSFNEVNPVSFSALNLAEITGGQVTALEAVGVAFSVLNTDPAAPPGAQPAGQPTGGSPPLQEADAIVFSVNNLATGAPAGALVASAGDRTLPRPDSPSRLAEAGVLPSRLLAADSLIVLDVSNRTLNDDYRGFKSSRREP